ncbi:MAG: peptide ABC transporter ATP-binding protein [Terriglobia bacterium]|nr:MAG: peptide ABC transporter ATP-binding protein [Terriglobia bacterium]
MEGVADMNPVLYARISADYPNRPGVLEDVEFAIGRGEILGLVGESGSGKSTIAMTLLRLIESKGGKARGELLFQDRNLLALPGRKMRRVRGREIGLVLQSPLSALNPSLRIGAQILEAWRAHRQGSPDLLQLLEMVNLPPEPGFLNRYPRQLSVGQAQRVLIAMAVIHRPALLIADEPTSALDVVTQAEILRLFSSLNRQMGTSILYISHDLLSVASFCHRIAILQQGRIVEANTTAEIFRNPQHPYTQALLAAIPKPPNCLETTTDCPSLAWSETINQAVDDGQYRAKDSLVCASRS